MKNSIIKNNEKMNVKPIKIKTMKKIGRNEKCICGSGKKYKKCCMRNDTKSSQPKNGGLNLLLNRETREIRKKTSNQFDPIEISGFDFFFTEKPSSIIINVCKMIISDLFQKDLTISIEQGNNSISDGIGENYKITLMLDNNIIYNSIDEYFKQVTMNMISVNDYLLSRENIFIGYNGWEVYMKTSMKTLNGLSSFLNKKTS